MGSGRKLGSVSTFITKTKQKKTTYKVDNTQCKKCLYRASQRVKNEMGCNCVYIFLMNHRRPSEPSPNCTAFRKYNKKERQQMEQELKEKFVTDRGVEYGRT